MLTSEHHATYEKRMGDTVYIITSECPPETNRDMTDAIIELAKRDLERMEGGKPLP